jgi:hypothetical protein
MVWARAASTRSSSKLTTIDSTDASRAIRSPRRNGSASAVFTTAAASMVPARGISGRTSIPASSPPVDWIVLALARL